MSLGLDIEAEVLRLGEEVERLTVKCQRLEQRLLAVEDRTSAPPSLQEASSSVLRVPETVVSDWSLLSTVATVEVGDRAGREELAKEIGRFLRRGLAGERLGTSGRDKLRLQNRCYLICKDFEGRVLEEPLFTTSFATVRSTCKRGSDCGFSLFVGFPSQWEARVAAVEAGVVVPPALR